MIIDGEEITILVNQKIEKAYQQGREDEQMNILNWFHNHDYTLAERVMNQYLEIEQTKEQKND